MDADFGASLLYVDASLLKVESGAPAYKSEVRKSISFLVSTSQKTSDNHMQRFAWEQPNLHKLGKWKTYHIHTNPTRRHTAKTEQINKAECHLLFSDQEVSLKAGSDTLGNSFLRASPTMVAIM